MKNSFVCFILSIILLPGCSNKIPQLGDSSIKDVISAMTLEEKARIVVGIGIKGFTDNSPTIDETQKIIPGAAGATYGIPRLGIPSIVLADGPAGLRINPTREGDSATYYCTHYPIGTLLASTWNEELVQSVGQAIGNEVLEYGIDVLLAPALNIHRNPLCGRNFEYYSEDPVVSGKIAAAYVKGVQSNGVGTSIKHFAANNQESNRMSNDSRVTPKALREIYLKGFEIAIKEANPWTVMSSYNYINGIYASENTELLTNLLRQEWDYTGLVITDWFGGKDAVAQMQAGNEMLQPGTKRQYESIIRAVNKGTLSEDILNKNVEKVLELIVKTPGFNNYPYSNNPDLQAHADIARKTAAEGMVLLKNDNNALPICESTKQIALFGSTSYDFIPGGTGSGNVNHAYTVSLLEGLTNAGYEVNEKLKKTYEEFIADEKAKMTKYNSQIAAFIPAQRPAEMIPSQSELNDLANTSDMALITIGRTTGELFDRNISDFTLYDDEKKLIENISRAFHKKGKKSVVILNIGGVIETASWKSYPDAILLAWLPGQEGGNSVADILTGIISPSGKLTMTFPVHYDDVASSSNFPKDGEKGNIDYIDQGDKNAKKNLWDYTNYEENIYVGYRYFDSFNVPVSYPFGYGLSYTEFLYENAGLKTADNKYLISLDILNTGKYAGKEIVQLYVSAPTNKSLAPDKELKAFAKTKELQPGEKTTVTFEVQKADLANYDEEKSSWITYNGDYQFKLGTSSQNIKAILSAPVTESVWQTQNILNLNELIPVLMK